MTTAPTRPHVLVVVAHPDDETFGCGSLLLHAAAAGARTSVLCATRGEAGNVAPGVRVPTTGVAASPRGRTARRRPRTGRLGRGPARLHRLRHGRRDRGRLAVRGAVPLGGGRRCAGRRAARP